MTARPRQQPFHEPIGTSPETYATSRRWIATLVLAVLILAAGVIVWLEATGRL